MYAKAANICGYLLISLALLVTATAADSEQVITRKPEAPIIINTKSQNYEQPTLSEYKDCVRIRDQCLSVCAGVSEREQCESQCIVCPELVEHDVVVQGVNDTAHVREPVSTPINTTNVIRLTNDIHNIIQTDISSQNVNNVTVNQDVSQVGGKYGLGYNEHGSCCYVLRRSRNCEKRRRRRQLSDGSCQTKRHRLCGEHCKARVMIARLVRKCEDEINGPCEHHVEYVPKRRHSRHVDRSSSPCRYMSQWPFVSCRHGSRRSQRAACTQCHRLTYSYVLTFGLPMQCHACFNFMRPNVPYWYPPYPMYPGMYDAGDSFGLNGNDFFWDEAGKPSHQPGLPGNGQQSDDDGWVLESVKCRLPDNTLTEDCSTADDAEAQPAPPSLPGMVGSGDDGLDDYQNGENTDYNDNDIHDFDYDVAGNRMRDAIRPRRTTFKRSSYSRRH